MASQSVRALSAKQQLLNMSQAVIKDPGDPFLEEAAHIAYLYVDLFDSDNAGVRRSTGGASNQGRVATDSVTSSGPPPPIVDEPAARIAAKLKEIGDNIDEKVKKELQDALVQEMVKSVYRFQSPQLTQVCRSVLIQCRDLLHSGWEQAAVVYMGTLSAVQELRRGSQQAAQRETMISGFAGEALRQLGLEAWIGQQGGMEQFGAPTQGVLACVPIEGTSVDS